VERAYSTALKPNKGVSQTGLLSSSSSSSSLMIALQKTDLLARGQRIQHGIEPRRELLSSRLIIIITISISISISGSITKDGPACTWTAHTARRRS
jgi:hypothetical protein